ncbi:MAG: cysteinyl-tRNA synthetase [Candidatus Tokpelaia sp. JSC161]|jgi:cysteinyl-tRNA synthetase|nr:MAG: cysteinyl-tRNA synthetase [Candidatus Tokpelaia sp. JSC161]
MANLRFYNTFTRRKEIFYPIDACNVRLYVCGPTVYDFAHIGNGRSVIVFDVLFRLLRYIFGEDHVVYVRNITDIDDKINMRAVRDYPLLPCNEAIRCLTSLTNSQFQEDVNHLGCLPPNVQPRASDYLSEMRAIIERLIQRGYAYVSAHHVIFSISSMGEDLRYGALSRRNLYNMLAGKRVSIADYKRDAMDFVLWKPSKKGEPGWVSPAGISLKGRPGWHIECSAMSMATLLQPFGGGLTSKDPDSNIFDIHGGGLDLIFPHHENEIAQTCLSLGSKRMANVWMHNGFLQVEGQKMSKSVGNFITIRSLLEKNFSHVSVDKKFSKIWAGLSARFAMLQTHYRDPLNWTDSRFVKASEELYRWYQFLRGVNFDLSLCKTQDDSVVDALSDDLNTWKAITILRHLYKKRDADALGRGMDILGLANNIFLKKSSFDLDNMDQLEIDHLIKKRVACLSIEDWNEADRIRDFLKRKGIILIDQINSEGTRMTSWEIVR